MNIVIAHGGDLSKPSGGTNRVSAFATGLHESDYTVTLVIPRPAEELPDRLDDVPVETVDVDTDGLLNEPVRAGKITRRAKQVAKQQDAKLQLEHSTLAGIGSLVGCSDYVLDMHDLAFPSPRYADQPLGRGVQAAIRWVETRGVKNAEKIVVVSKQMQTLVQEEWPVPDEAFAVVPNGYFPETIDGYEQSDNNVTRVTFLGTLHPKLNTETFVEIAQLPAVDELAVIGDGAKYDVLQGKKKEHSLDALKLYGQLPDEEAFPLLVNSTIAINPQHPSRLQRASSPVKLYYYAALGVPMVVTSGPDVTAKLAETGAAVVVPPNEQFSPVVEALLNDEDRLKRMRATVDKLGAKWTWSQRADSLTEVYDSIL